jgi:hypothetical protein
MSFAYMLQHSSLTHVALVAMLANVLLFFEVNSLNVFHQMVLPGKRFIAVVALLHFMTLGVADMLLQGFIACVLLGTNWTNKISFSCVNTSHVLVQMVLPPKVFFTKIASQLFISICRQRCH